MRATGGAGADGPDGNAVTGTRGLPGLAAWIGLGLGLLVIAITTLTIAIVEQTMIRRADRQALAVVESKADTLARLLERGMYERWRELRLFARTVGEDLSAGPAVAEDPQWLDRLRGGLDRMQVSYPLYSWLGFVRSDGILIASSIRRFEGSSVRDRDWFEKSQDRPFLGDVRDAGVIAAEVKRHSDDPVRFIDIAAPIRRDDGSSAGIIAAHLNWDWAADIMRLLPDRVDAQSAEAIIARRDGLIIAGPQALRNTKLPPAVLAAMPAAGRVDQQPAATRLEWPGTGRAYYVGAAPLAHSDEYPSPQWIAVARWSSEAAHAETGAWRWRAFLLAVPIFLALLLPLMLVVRWLVRGLGELTRAARAAAEGQPWALAAGRPRARELASLLGAVDRLVSQQASQLDRLTAANRDLEQRVTERTRQLRGALAAQVEAGPATAGATAGRGPFLTAVGQEIRPAMEAIAGIAQAILRDSPDPEARAQARRLLDTADALQPVLDDTADLSRIDAGQVPVTPRPFRLSDLVERCIGTARPLADAKGVTLAATIDPAVPDALSADRQRMQQIVTSLLTGLVRQTAAARVRLTVSIEAAAGTRLDLRFEVSDMADGAQPGRAPAGEGNLGLVLAQGLAGALGGRLDARMAQAGGGTAIACILPVSAGPADARPAETAAERPGLRILLVDDVAINRATLAALLDTGQNVLDEAGDGEDAVRLAAEGGYDLILMDRFMPGMDGLEATRRIRALPGPAGRTPIHGLTGAAAGSDLATCLAAGMDGVMAKPVRPDALQALLASLTAAAAAVPTPDPAPDLQAADRLRRSLGEAAFTGLQRQFSTFAHETAAALAAAVVADDTDEIVRVAHMIAGTSGSFGHPSLSQEAHALQRAARAGQPAADIREGGRRLARSTAEAARRVEAALATPA
ncbi:hypothetical protein STHU_45640 [Allostella humosa]|nr:hypothetical protein STHU_45640 [Stella humosa]